MRAILVATGLSSFGPMPVFFLGGLAVLVRQELGFSEVRLGASVAVFFAFAATGSAPAGNLADRFGARRALLLGLAVTLTALLGLTLARSWLQLTSALAIAGVGHAVLTVGANALLANDVPPGSQGLAFGIKQSAIPFATLTAGAAVPAIGTTLGWRWAYGGAAVAAGLVLLAQARRRRVASAGRPRRPRQPAGTPFDRRQLTVLAVAMAFAGGSANAMAAFLVEFLAAEGMPLPTAGTLLAIVSLAGLTTRITVGWLADVRSSTDLLGVAGLLLTGSVAFVLLPVTDASSPMIWIVAAFAFAAGWGWPGLTTYIVAMENSHAPGEATGVTQAGVFAGAVAGPLLFGVAVSTLSYTTAWWATAFAQLLAASLTLVVRGSRRHGRQPAT